jgi:PAB1-binding protein PBP1
MLQGMEVAVSLKDGHNFSGVFSAASIDSADPRVTLKFAQKTSQQANGTTDQPNEYVGEGQDHVMTFSLQDVVDLSVNNLHLAASETRAQQANAPSFRTDVEISGNLNIRERELQPWQPSADTAIDMSLEDNSRPGEWDQFAANEALYNVRSDYDENLYTTAIDRSDPDYRRKAAEAERIAREIERSAPVNSHVAEERRMNAEKDGGLDEEEK